tara:strand:+ start:3266 stop:3616 length:351 start_codon:yes stop_codon:yes gene_type:complete
MTKKLYTLETAKNKYSDRDYNVNISFPEFSCLCPRTGLPDFATIIIDYTPDKLLVELKSLKLYFLNYRDKGIFHEHATNMILDDFRSACNPKKVSVRAIFGTRGGIDTIVESSWPK